MHCPSGLRSKAEISPPGTPVQKVFMLHRPQEDTFHGVTAPSAHTVLIQSSFLEAVVFQGRI